MRLLGESIAGGFAVGPKLCILGHEIGVAVDDLNPLDLRLQPDPPVLLPAVTDSGTESAGVPTKREVWDRALTGKRHSAPAAWVRGSVIVLASCYAITARANRLTAVGRLDHLGNRSPTQVPLAVTASPTTSLPGR